MSEWNPRAVIDASDDFHCCTDVVDKFQIPRSKMEDGAKPRDLEDRTFEFAQSVRAFVKQLPRTVSNTEDVGTSGVIHKLNIEKLIAANPLSPRLRRGFRKRRHFTALQKES